MGEHKLPDPSQEEQRLTLYLTGALLDLAEGQTTRAGIETVQEYCARLLQKAIEAERTREQVAEIEVKRGPLKGLREIAADPEYLAEWSVQVGSRELPAPDPQDPGPAPAPEPAPAVEVPVIAVEMPVLAQPVPDAPGPAAAIVLRHAGQAGDDPMAFLPSLRRGEGVRMDAVSELAQALQTLEDQHRGAGAIDRRLAYALHRLAFEGQILHTDAWPGAFDEWTVETLRAVQEYVDRILSGQDIRYYLTDSPPEASR